MAPNTKEEVEVNTPVPLVDKDRKLEIIYRNVALFAYLYTAGAYGLYLCFTSAKWATIVFAWLMYVGATLGVTAGAHRLWAHRSYKVKLPLEIFLMLCNCLTFQNTVIHWVRDHRLHHKFSDTEADPHNSRRGLFYSHVGWLLVKKSDAVRREGKKIYMDDILANPVLRFQKKYAIPLIGSVCFLLPTIIPVYFWNESIWNAWHIAISRYIISLNATFLVNSFAHYWGYRPYDKDIPAVQNIPLTLLTIGEGFHNYHHSFPWDYRSSELGNDYINLTTKIIDFFAWVGLVYDRKVASDGVVGRKKARSGDGTTIWGGKSRVEQRLAEEIGGKSE